MIFSSSQACVFLFQCQEPQKKKKNQVTPPDDFKNCNKITGRATHRKQVLPKNSTFFCIYLENHEQKKREKKKSGKLASTNTALRLYFIGLLYSNLVNCNGWVAGENCSRVGEIDQIDQIDHDLDHLDPNVPSCDVVRDLYSTASSPGSRSLIMQIIRLAPGNMSQIIQILQNIQIIQIRNISAQPGRSRSYRSYRSYRSRCGMFELTAHT